MTRRQTLLFVSPRFLFPVDSGGKIRFHKVGVMSPTEEQGLLESLRALQ